MYAIRSYYALGIMPYISSSIIMQMASHIVPSLQQLRKEGEQGRRIHSIPIFLQAGPKRLMQPTVIFS